MKKEKDWQAEIAKWGAVMTAAPRWIGAMMEAEGVSIPAAWQGGWRIFVLFLSIGMAITEALSFAYIFNAWRTQKDKSASKLLWLAALSAVVFVLVLAPYIAAQVREVSLSEILVNSAFLWIWSIAVATSTIMIVASVGYAQKYKISSATTTKRGVKVEKTEVNVTNREIAKQRRMKILSLIKENVDQDVTKLAKKFGVSDQTIRNDYKHLSNVGQILYESGKVSLPTVDYGDL